MVSKARAFSIWVSAAFSGAPSMTATSTIKLSRAVRYWRETTREREREKKKILAILEASINIYVPYCYLLEGTKTAAEIY